MLFFRATTVASAFDLVKGVFGLNGMALPHGAAAVAATYGTDIKQAAMWIAILLLIALICPNTLQILAPYEPALGVKPASTAPIYRNPSHSCMGALASLGGRRFGRRGHRGLHSWRPKRVSVLAVLGYSTDPCLR